MIRDVTVALSKINILNDKHFFKGLVLDDVTKPKLEIFFRLNKSLKAFFFHSITTRINIRKASLLMSFKLSSSIR